MHSRNPLIPAPSVDESALTSFAEIDFDAASKVYFAPTFRMSMAALAAISASLGYRGVADE